MIKKIPRPNNALKRGRPIAKTAKALFFKKSETEFSIKIPAHLYDAFLTHCKTLNAETNSHAAITTAVLWFLKQPDQQTYPYFLIREFIFGDQKIKLPEVLVSAIGQQFSEPLNVTVSNAVQFLVRQPLARMLDFFRPVSFSFYCRGEKTLKKQVQAYMRKMRMYARERGFACNITQAKLVIAAMMFYMQNYPNAKNTQIHSSYMAKSL